MTDKQLHLQMLQATISRMAGNSFLLKGWSVVLLSALFALATGLQTRSLVWLAYFPLIAFWGLDAYFLRQERLFRNLYNRVRLIPGDNADLSMDTKPASSEVASWIEVVFSRTLFFFHGVLVGTVAVVYFLLNKGA